MPELSKCRSCGREIVWCKTAATGSLMPLDPDPVENGNIVIKDGVAHVLKGELFEDFVEGDRYVSHFSSCPNASAHRKKK